MKIIKHPFGYLLSLSDEAHVQFTKYKVRKACIELSIDGRHSAAIYNKTEFFKAWRAMLCNQ